MNRDSTSRVRVFKNIPRGVIEQEGGRGQGVKVQMGSWPGIGLKEWWERGYYRKGVRG